MKEGEPRGKIAITEAENVVPGAFFLFTGEVDSRGDVDKFKVGDLKMGEGHDLADRLIGIGIMKSETEQGTDVLLVIPPGTSVQLPPEIIPGEDVD